MICVPISLKLHSVRRTAPAHNPWHSLTLGASCVVNVTRTKRSASTRWCSERCSHLLETWSQFIVSNKFGAHVCVCALCRVHVRDAVKNWTLAPSERWKTTIEHFSWPALCQEVYTLRQWQWVLSRRMWEHVIIANSFFLHNENEISLLVVRTTRVHNCKQ